MAPLEGDITEWMRSITHYMGWHPVEGRACMGCGEIYNRKDEARRHIEIFEGRTPTDDELLDGPNE